MCPLTSTGGHGERVRRWLSQKVGRHAQPLMLATVAFVARRRSCDRHERIAVVTPQPGAMLILLDAGHIDEKRDPGHVVQMQRRAVAPWLPTLPRERRKARIEIEALCEGGQRRWEILHDDAWRAWRETWCRQDPP